MRFEVLRDQTIIVRQRFVDVVESTGDRADVVPPGWNNNLHWHLGHLVLTPRLLTLGLMGEEIGLPAGYRAWFMKGTGPADWGGSSVPSVETLARQAVDGMRDLLDDLADRLETEYPSPYTTSAGVILTNLAETIQFSLAHDGIHLGLAMALRRALVS